MQTIISINGKAESIGHGVTHQDAGADEVDATGLAGRINYADRGDPAAVDFTQATLTTRDAYTDLSLAGILPAGAKAAILTIRVQATTANKTVAFRKNGNSNPYNQVVCLTQVANIILAQSVIIPVDTNRVIEYYIETATWSEISVTVSGWFI